MTFPKISPRYLWLILLFSLLSFPVSSVAQVNLSQAQLREKSLKTATTPSDSIKILLDVYSLSDKVNRDRVRNQLINLAQRSDNKDVLHQVVRELATSTDDTDQLARLIEICDSLAEEDGKDTLQTVLKMEQAQSEASTVVDSDVENQMASDIRMGFDNDPYKEIQNIYRTMAYLGTSSEGPLYFEYIKRLEYLINQLPDEDHAIKNVFYTNAAIFYTRKKDYKRALEADRKLIKELDSMKALYKDQDKAARDLNYYYYVSYRRMLRNFKGLTPEEIEDIYNKCVELAKIDEKAAEEYGNGGLTNSYYFVATKQYAKAIPELKKALSNPHISDFRKSELLGLLSLSMRQTGNRDGELEALRQYVHMLRKERVDRRNDMYHEVELRNSVNKIISDEYRAQEQQRNQNRVMRQTSLTLVYVLAVVLIFLCGAYLRLRNKVKELEVRNNKLHRNIEYIFDDGVPKGTRDIHHNKNKLKG